MGNFFDFYSEVTTVVDEVKTVAVVYLYFNKAFDTVSCNIITDKMTKYRLDKWTGLKTG